MSPLLPPRLFIAVLSAVALYTAFLLGTLYPAPAAPKPPSSIPFAVFPALLPAPQPPPSHLTLPPLDLPALQNITLPHPTPPNLIPPIVHQIYALSGLPPPPLPYFQYLALRSTLLSLRPRLLLLHHHHLTPPHGPYWDLLSPYITLSPLTPPTHIFSNPLDHFAHKADVLRLQLLLQHGGIYIDIDTFVLRDFARAGLLTQDTVLAMEASPNSDHTEWEPGGLCNAVIIAKPGAMFLRRWLATYESFDGSNWAGHSVAKPWELALLYPRELTILNNRAMFHPLWRSEDIRLVHEPSSPGPDGGGWDFFASGQLAYHAWESLAMSYLSALTPSLVLKGESSFTRMARAFVSPQDVFVERMLEAQRGENG